MPWHRPGALDQSPRSDRSHRRRLACGRRRSDVLHRQHDALGDQRITRSRMTRDYFAGETVDQPWEAYAQAA